MNQINNQIIDMEMLLHVPLCSHREPKNILILSQNVAFEKELEKYPQIQSQIVSQEFEKVLESANDDFFDVVIIDAKELVSLTFIAQVNRVLKDDGLVVSKTAKKKEDMQNYAGLFGIVMPYRFTTLDGFEEVVFASKRYHPTADIILQRSDLLDDLNYYNTEIHLGSFALATYERKELAGIYKQ